MKCCIRYGLRLVSWTEVSEVRNLDINTNLYLPGPSEDVWPALDEQGGIGRLINSAASERADEKREGKGT